MDVLDAEILLLSVSKMIVLLVGDLLKSCI